MVEGIVEANGDLAAGCDGDGRVGLLKLVAADVAGCHVADEAIVLPVLGLAHSSPDGRALDLRDRVWRASVIAIDGGKLGRSGSQWAVAVEAASRRTARYCIFDFEEQG